MSAPSYCVVCDAGVGACEHGGARYLGDVAYTPVHDDAGLHVGWRVPDKERARWDAAPQRVAPRVVDVETRSLDVILGELEGTFFLDSLLLARLEKVYELDPVRVSTLTTWMLEHATGEGIRNPAGILWSRLGELERRAT